MRKNETARISSIEIDLVDGKITRRKCSEGGAACVTLLAIRVWKIPCKF